MLSDSAGLELMTINPPQYQILVKKLHLYLAEGVYHFKYIG